jgi:hypothetical protein
MADNVIIENLKEHVLPIFSHYRPAKKIIKLDEGDLILNNSKDNYGTGSRYRYKIPIKPDEFIIDIFDVYFKNNNENIMLDEFGYLEASLSNLTDMTIFNSYMDMSKYMRARRTWEFFPPNLIEFDLRCRGAIIIYQTSHNNLDTIQPDLYTSIFKPMCSAYVKKWLSSLRSKYESLTTPIGEIKMNWQKLDQEATQELEEIKRNLDTLPPDRFLEVNV